MEQNVLFEEKIHLSPKDMNKLSELMSDPYKKLNLENFFSSDVLDIKWIPKFRRKKNNNEVTDYNKKFDNFKNI